MEAAQKAVSFLGGITFEEFANDDRTSFAVVRALEIVGEAAKGIPANIRARASSLPWQEMAGTRDKLIHAYHGIDLAVVWRTVKEDLPPLIVEIQGLLETIPADDR